MSSPSTPKFPDLFLLCEDTTYTRTKYAHRKLVVLEFKYPKPHTMIAVIIEEKEINTWQEKGSGGL